MLFAKTITISFTIKKKKLQIDLTKNMIDFIHVNKYIRINF